VGGPRRHLLDREAAQTGGLKVRGLIACERVSLLPR
jgi:hypothetical protein